MTREEAIEELNRLNMHVAFHENFWESTKERIIKALEMANEELEKPEIVPCEKCAYVKSCRKVIILKNRTYKLVKWCSNGTERKKP